MDSREDMTGETAAAGEAEEAAVTDRYLADLLDILRRRGETVTTVESLTAGMISARIADIPGASDVMKRAYVTYCDEAKHEMAGVRTQTLRQYTAVSRSVAGEMCHGGALAAGADLCLSATGYAGPASGPGDDTVGLVYLGCYYREKTLVEKHHYSGSRNEVRAQARDDALRMMGQALESSR